MADPRGIAPEAAWRSKSHTGGLMSQLRNSGIVWKDCTRLKGLGAHVYRLPSYSTGVVETTPLSTGHGDRIIRSLSLSLSLSLSSHCSTPPQGRG